MLMRTFDPTRRTALLLFVLIVLAFAPSVYHFAYDMTIESDFSTHIEWAIALVQNGPGNIQTDVLALAGLQIALIVVRKLFDSTFEFAALFVALSSIGLTAVILFFWYVSSLSKMNWPGWKICLIVFGVCIAAPVTLLWPLDRLMYLGYIGITSHHNPTIILLKPFAILQFIFAYQCFRKTGLVHNWQIALFALISVLGTYIKPSLAICILPALAIFAAYCILKKEYLNYKALFLGIGLPTVIVLLWQYALTYSAADLKDGVVFLPFVVMKWYSNYLGWKLLLSLAFPLAVLIVYFNQAIKDTRMILAWLICSFGLIYTYLFAESGPRLIHGNFGWSGEIASVLLFAISTLFYFEQPDEMTKPGKPLTLLWSLHVVFGILYYFYCIFARTYH